MPSADRPPFGSLRTSFRLSLQFAFLYSVLSAMVLASAYWMTDFEVQEVIHDQMRADAGSLAKTFEDEGLAALVERISFLNQVNFGNARFFRLTDQAGATLAGDVLTVSDPPTSGFLPARDVALDRTPFEDVTGYWIIQRPIGPYTLMLGTGNRVVSEVLEGLGTALIAGVVLIVGLGMITGVWVGRITEQRLAEISSTLRQVAEGTLTARVPVSEASNDDLARVSVRINQTLAQLEALIESQQQISNDIAHDMRTPLQRLRQRLERMGAQETPDPEDCAAALQETEDIIATFNALMRIAQVEAGDRRERFVEVDLADVAERVHDAYEPAAEEAGQSLVLSAPAGAGRVTGDPNLLVQMVSNLVENALRYSPPGTRIEIGVTSGPNSASIHVSDGGPGIAPGETDKVFRRFYRGEKSRTSEGHGLGLAMVKAIAKLHHAEISLTDNRPGLRVVVTFPPATDNRPI